ncbi:MAG: PaaI family thioesterase [Myxococcota bacterium]|jgi:uncharacterized protein (TIGR00369 family)|nr:PaaI family thioesterase [Myxococcota bacterium]
MIDKTQAPTVIDSEPMGFAHALPRFVAGDRNPERIDVRYQWVDGRVEGEAQLGPLAAGPPGHAHGGAITSLLDEAMGYAAWIVAGIVLTARIEVDFLRPVRLPTSVRVLASVSEHSGRKVTTEGSLLDQNGMVLARSRAVFVLLPPDKAEKLGNTLSSPPK